MDSVLFRAMSFAGSELTICTEDQTNHVSGSPPRSIEAVRNYDTMVLHVAKVHLDH